MGLCFHGGVPWRQGHRTPPELTEQVAPAGPGCSGFQVLWLQSPCFSSRFLGCLVPWAVLCWEGFVQVVAGQGGALCPCLRLGRLHSDRGAGSVTGSSLLVLRAALVVCRLGGRVEGDRLVSRVTAAAPCLSAHILPVPSMLIGAPAASPVAVHLVCPAARCWPRCPSSASLARSA